jgi:glycosyltransferase involved in cell wall biosynthesis
VCDADVPDTLPYLHRARAAIVPLLEGGGTRLKIVEAWAAGVPVVSTPLGAHGLGCVDGVDVLLAADVSAFADALHRVLEDDALYSRLRESGLRRAEALRWTRLTPVLEGLYASRLRG